MARGTYRPFRSRWVILFTAALLAMGVIVFMISASDNGDIAGTTTETEKLTPQRPARPLTKP